MNFPLVIFLMFLIIVGVIAYGVNLAMHGSIAAAFIMGFVFAMFVLVIFYGIIQGLDFINEWQRNRAEQKRFEANIRENQEIMLSQVRASAVQAQAVQRQLTTANAMSRGEEPNYVTLPPDLFSQVED